MLVACSGKVDLVAESSHGGSSGASSDGAHSAVDAGPDATAPGGNDLRIARGDDASGGADGDATGNPSQGPVATSYLIDPAHTGFAPASTLRPPLARVWSATLPGAASYPLIAGGRVFVVSANSGTASGTEIAGPSLFALDAQTGDVVWSKPLAASFAAHAYDGGRVFAVDGAGGVTAFDAATGSVLWTRSMAGVDITDYSTIPTAYDGVLYTSADGTGGTLFAFDEAAGAQIFTIYSPYFGDGSPPALDDHGLVVAYACEQTYSYDRLTGASLWHYSTGCGGGGSDVPVLQGGQVFVPDPMANVVLNEVTGSSVGTFAASQPPAFDGTYGVFADGTQLTAIQTSTGLTAWTYGEDDQVYFQMPPLIAGGYVYTFDSSQKVTAFDEATGKPVWSDPAPAYAPPGDSSATPALAAAGGLLVVPEGSQVVAYASAPDAGAPSTRAADGGCGWTLQPGQNLTTDDNPFGITIGDFNGDGRPDLAVADFVGSTDVVPWEDGVVSVFLGNGDGTFRQRVDYAVGPGAWAIEAADFNGDRILNLAVVDRGGNDSTPAPAASVSVLLGKGDGTFAPAKSYPTNPYPLSLTVADLNGDGALDLALASDATPNLSLLMGKGDGSFGAPISIAAPANAAADAVAAADLNGDGRADSGDGRRGVRRRRVPGRRRRRARHARRLPDRDGLVLRLRAQLRRDRGRERRREARSRRREPRHLEHQRLRGKRERHLPAPGILRDEPGPMGRGHCRHRRGRAPGPPRHEHLVARPARAPRQRRRHLPAADLLRRAERRRGLRDGRPERRRSSRRRRRQRIGHRERAARTLRALSEALFREAGSKLVTKRIGEAAELAEAYCYLMENTFTTGQTPVVDGGGVLV